SGRVLLTDLGNLAMPLIRYEVGDRAAWAAERRCHCSDDGECIRRLEGRTSDFVWSADGRAIHRAWFNSLILSVPGVRQYRLVQESLRSLRVEVVENRPIAEGRARDVCRRIRETLGGDVEVRWQRRASLPQTPLGKYRYVESRVSPPARLLSGRRK
ncbi:MAG TPA: phenylacetate--CoA ligase family protein, partial [Phycisphaerae bacterium]|nr:phenylacetate--CoA ligase family protein [Phycisphaerae bacterium]